jgi:ankyrin repeat protein
MLERIADGRTDLVFDYLAQGHAADSVDGGGVSLIRWCAYYGDVSAVRYLVSGGASLGALGENLDLNGASFHGHWQLCEFLIEHGADVNHALPDTGETPLHAALCHANRPAYNLVLRVLLRNGADPNRATKVGAQTGSFMRDCRTRGETPLHRAAAFGNAEAIQLLLDAGAVIDARDANGDTPLSWASWHLRPGAILRMLCHGEHSISARGVAHYTGDHGMGWGGLEASLRGKPHAERSAAQDRPRN